MRGSKKLPSIATRARGRRSDVILRARTVVPFLLAVAGSGVGCASNEGASAPPVVAPTNRVGQTPGRGRAPDAEPLFDLSPSVINETVRASFFKFKRCYEAGLARDPKLTGRLSVRFVIERDGSVSDARESAPPHPDPSEANAFKDAPEVVACSLAVYRGLRFPTFTKSERTTVVYPISLSPGDP